jgi:hypothetical protein
MKNILGNALPWDDRQSDVRAYSELFLGGHSNLIDHITLHSIIDGLITSGSILAVPSSSFTSLSHRTHGHAELFPTVAIDRIAHTQVLLFLDSQPLPIRSRCPACAWTSTACPTCAYNFGLGLRQIFDFADHSVLIFGLHFS